MLTTQRFVTIIINVTAAMAMQIPIIIFVVKGSPNTSVPMRIAVMGSKTPSTDAFVAPIFRVAIAKVAVDTIVGRIAKPKIFIQLEVLEIPVVIDVSVKNILIRKTIAPTLSA